MINILLVKYNLMVKEILAFQKINIFFILKINYKWIKIKSK
jgi:hypothetical protein